MQSFDMISSISAQWRPERPGAPDTLGSASQIERDRQKNHQFVDLLNAFRRSGGLARAPEVAARFRSYDVNAVSPLAAWVNKREVISFEWQSKLWLPLFQFNPVGLTLRAGLSSVLVELLGIYDEWDMANWFAQPNPWLADRTPADMLAVAAPQVLNAARADRFVAAG